MASRTGLRNAQPIDLTQESQVIHSGGRVLLLRLIFPSEINEQPGAQSGQPRETGNPGKSVLHPEAKKRKVRSSTRSSGRKTRACTEKTRRIGENRCGEHWKRMVVHKLLSTLVEIPDAALRKTAKLLILLIVQIISTRRHGFRVGGNPVTSLGGQVQWRSYGRLCRGKRSRSAQAGMGRHSAFGQKREARRQEAAVTSARRAESLRKGLCGRQAPSGSGRRLEGLEGFLRCHAATLALHGCSATGTHGKCAWDGLMPRPRCLHDRDTRSGSQDASYAGYRHRTYRGSRFSSANGGRPLSSRWP